MLTCLVPTAALAVMFTSLEVRRKVWIVATLVATSLFLVVLLRLVLEELLTSPLVSVRPTIAALCLSAQATRASPVTY